MVQVQKNEKNKPSKSTSQNGNSNEPNTSEYKQESFFDEDSKKLNDPGFLKEKIEDEKRRIQKFENLYNNVDTSLYNKDYILFIELQQFADSIPIWRRIKVPGGIYLHDLRRAINAALGWTGSHSFQFEIFLPGEDIPITIHSDLSTLEVMKDEIELSQYLHSRCVTLAMIAPKKSGQHPIPKQLSEKEVQKLQREARKKNKAPPKKKRKTNKEEEIEESNTTTTTTTTIAGDTDKTKENEKENDLFYYEYDMGDSWMHSIWVETVVDRSVQSPIVALLAGSGACPPEDCGGISGYSDLLHILNSKPSMPGYDEKKEKLEWLENVPNVNLDEDGNFNPNYFNFSERKEAIRRTACTIKVETCEKPKQKELIEPLPETTCILKDKHFNETNRDAFGREFIELNSLTKLLSLVSDKKPDDAKHTIHQRIDSIVTRLQDIANHSYSSPVDKLLEFSDGCHFHREGLSWPDYVSIFEFEQKHVPELIRMAGDVQLRWANEDNESKANWAPVHAWRALSQLKAESAIEPLMNVCSYISKYDDEFISHEIPEVLVNIGTKATPATLSYANDVFADSEARIVAIEAAKQIAKKYSQVNIPVVEGLASILVNYEQNDYKINGAATCALVELKAKEKASIIKRVYEKKCIQEMTLGDFEQVEVELGIRARREHPRVPMAGRLGNTFNHMNFLQMLPLMAAAQRGLPFPFAPRMVSEPRHMSFLFGNRSDSDENDASDDSDDIPAEFAHFLMHHHHHHDDDDEDEDEGDEESEEEPTSKKSKSKGPTKEKKTSKGNNETENTKKRKRN